MSEVATVKRIGFFMLLIAIFFTLAVEATDFPQDKEALVLDEENYFIRPEIEALIENIKSKSAAFRVVIISAVDEPLTTQEYTNQLFEYLELPDDGLLLVMAMESGEIVAKPGAGLIDLGIDGTLLTQKIESLIVDNASHNKHLEGIGLFIDSIDNEITSARQRQATLEASIVHEKAEQKSDANVLGMPIWLKVILILTILAALALVYLYWTRRKMMGMMEDLTTIKQGLEERLLNFDGIPEAEGHSAEAKRRLQGIKIDWKQLAEQYLPELEMHLFEIEEEISHLHFHRAKQLMIDTDQLMEQVEQDALQMVEEWHAWIEETENVQGRAIQLEQRIGQLQQELLSFVNDGKLSMASIQTEWKQLDEGREELQTLQEAERMVEAGPLLDSLEEVVAKLDSFAQLVPRMSEEMEIVIPKELDDLTEVAKQMEAHGFALHKVGFYEQLERLRKTWAYLLTQFHEGELRSIVPQVESLKQEIDGMFQQVEDEAVAKEKTKETLQGIRNQWNRLEEKREQLLQLAAEVNASYHLSAEEVAATQALTSLPQEQEEMKAKLEQIEVALQGEEPVYHQLYQELLKVKQMVEGRVAACDEWTAKLQVYQEGEREAAEKLEQLYRRLIKVENRLRRTNLPALPGDLISALEIAGMMLDEADEKMEEQPFNLLGVQQQLAELEKQVFLVEEKSIDAITACEEAEEMIQFAYRYRHDPEALQLIREAERLFRQAEFNQALEVVHRILDRHQA